MQLLLISVSHSHCYFPLGAYMNLQQQHLWRLGHTCSNNYVSSKTRRIFFIIVLIIITSTSLLQLHTTVSTSCILDMNPITSPGRTLICCYTGTSARILPPPLQAGLIDANGYYQSTYSTQLFPVLTILHNCSPLSDIAIAVKGILWNDGLNTTPKSLRPL